MELKARITEDMKTCMRSGDKSRLGVVRLILAEIKQREVDERITLSDEQVLAVLTKMVKQRKDSITQFVAGARQDLADIEQFELGIIQAYMPEMLSDADVEAAIAKAVAETGASSAKDMGKVMGILNPQLRGRADMTVVSAKVKAALG